MQIRRTDSLRAAEIEQLIELLIDAVSGGASIGWVSVPSRDEANAYWKLVAQQLHEQTAVLLVAEERERIVGTVQLQLSSRPNATHRGEVARLLVHSQARHRGVGTALMAAIEAEARPLGISLLVLDTRTGDRSQRLYERIGYTLAGVVPCYARGTNGELEATSIMYKQLAGP
jgi:ribosomal protein S18 acetylase RimI-like enzyme